MLRRGRSAPQGDARVFLGARPVPTRVAGYAPVPLETGRAPQGKSLEIPPANTTTAVTAPPTPIIGPTTTTPTLIPPTLVVGPPIVGPPTNPCPKPNPDGTCPTPPPCPNPNPDGTCPNPPPPPVDVPEPATWLILLAGVAALWFGLSGRRRRA